MAKAGERPKLVRLDSKKGTQIYLCGACGGNANKNGQLCSACGGTGEAN